MLTIGSLHAARATAARPSGVAGLDWRPIRDHATPLLGHHWYGIGFAPHNVVGPGAAHMKDLLLFQRVNTKLGFLTC
jgi:hypothetical protein